MNSPISFVPYFESGFKSVVTTPYPIAIQLRHIFFSFVVRPKYSNNIAADRYKRSDLQYSFPLLVDKIRIGSNKALLPNEAEANNPIDPVITLASSKYHQTSSPLK
jgi:hypothetical protein